MIVLICCPIPHTAEHADHSLQSTLVLSLLAFDTPRDASFSINGKYIDRMSLLKREPFGHCLFFSSQTTYSAETPVQFPKSLF